MVKIIGRRVDSSISGQVYTKSRYKWLKTLIGREEKPCWVKVPNMINMRGVIYGRKILHMQHLHKRLQKRKGPSKLTKEDYKERLEKLLSKPLQYVTRKPSDWKIKLNKVKAEARAALKAKNAELNNENQNNVEPVTDDDNDEEDYEFAINNESEEAGASTEEKLIEIPPIKILPGPSKIEEQLNNYKRRRKVYCSFGERKKKFQENIETDEWKSKNWGMKVRQVFHSYEVNEIISNRRLVAEDIKDVDQKKPPIINIFLESIHQGIFQNDWLMVMKSVECLSTEFNRGYRYWILWNGGFLALANLFKDEVDKIVEFGSYVKDIMLSYPIRMGIDVGVWLIQKGMYDKGIELLQNWIETPRRQFFWRIPKICDNPKRKMIDLIATLIRAVYCYANWRRDMRLVEIGQYTQTEESLKILGERTLSYFEEVMNLSDEIDTDVMIFIEPLIELTLNYRTKERAKEIFKKLLSKEFLNGHLEELYVEFLETHFPDLEEEIKSKMNHWTNRFTSTDRSIKAKAVSNAKLKKARLKRLNECVIFSQLPLPGFSW